MTTGVVTTSFPRHPGDFAGCFVEDNVRARARDRDSETIEVIAAGAPGLNHERRDLPDNVRVWQVAVPTPRGARPLFYGDGAPETLERGGAAAWTQALFFWAGLCQRIAERANRWDRIVAHWLVPCGLAAHAVAPYVPLIAYAHSGDVALLERLPGGAALGRRLARDAAEVNFVSADLKDRFARLTGIVTGHVVRLAPGEEPPRRLVTTASATRALARRALGVDGPTVLSVGRLVPIKGFDVLLAAMARTTADARPGDAARPRPVLVILGEGPERRRLEKLAANLGVDLRLPGLVPRPDVTDWMRAADVYVQPSRRLATGRTEGLPVATLEALAAGLPVVASRTGGLAELWSRADVTLVPPQDAPALAAELRLHTQWG